jgi:methylglutaconyl-CoA hydratase
MASFTNILVESGSAVARITLNRPTKRNALSAGLIAEVTEALDLCAKDDKVRVIVLNGAGSDFCSGADLQALEKNKEATVLEMMEDARKTADLFLRMRQLPRPIIAAVQGRALAGGCGLAMAADLVLASQSAQFGYPEINVGFIPAMVTAMLRRVASEKTVFELVTTGEIISATRAWELGLINRVFSDPDFQREVDTYATALSVKPPAALALAKKLVYHLDGMSLAMAVEAGLHLNVLARKTDDFEQGVRRFLSKSPGQKP